MLTAETSLYATRSNCTLPLCVIFFGYRVFADNTEIHQKKNVQPQAHDHVQMLIKVNYFYINSKIVPGTCWSELSVGMIKKAKREHKTANIFSQQSGHDASAWAHLCAEQKSHHHESGDFAINYTRPWKSLD